MDRRGQRLLGHGRSRRPTRPDPDPGGELWGRVAALQGRVLKTRSSWLHVVYVDASGVTVRPDPVRPQARLSRRLLEEAAPFVAAGEPLPPRFGTRAPRLAAVLRAAGIGPDA